MTTNYDGAATLVQADGRRIEVKCRYEVRRERGGLQSWAGFYTDPQPPHVSDAGQRGPHELVFKDGRKGQVFITNNQIHRGTFQGTGPPPE